MPSTPHVRITGLVIGRDGDGAPVLLWEVLAGDGRLLAAGVVD